MPYKNSNEASSAHGWSFRIATLFVLSLLCFKAASAQQPAQSLEDLHNSLPPSAVYAQTLQPLEATRADMANWSETELAALSSATLTAHAECARLEQVPGEGEELFNLARLCALGQDWPGTYSAVTIYLRDDHAPHLPQGYFLLTQANLNMGKVGDILSDLTAMQTRLPYTPDTDAVINYALANLEISRPTDGINLALVRQSRLLEAVSGNNPTLAPGTAESEAWHLLELLRFDNRVPKEIDGVLDDLNHAIAARSVPLSPTDAYTAAMARRRYDALGKPMPSFTIMRTTEAKPWIAKPTDVNLFVLYPGNCVTCATIPDTIAALRKGLNTRARAWTLIETSPEEESKSLPSLHPRGSVAKNVPVPPALYTSTQLRQRLALEGTLAFIVTDIKGNVRFLSSGPITWLHPDAHRDILIQTVMERVLHNDDGQNVPSQTK